MRDDEVVFFVERSGFHLIGRSPEAHAYARGAQTLTLRSPNQEGNPPETLVNDAFDAAGLTPPAWDVFWCD